MAVLRGMIVESTALMIRVVMKMGGVLGLPLEHSVEGVAGWREGCCLIAQLGVYDYLMGW